MPLYNTSIGLNSSRNGERGYKTSAITSRHATSINEHDRVFSKDPPSITYSMLVSPRDQIANSGGYNGSQGLGMSSQRSTFSGSQHNVKSHFSSRMTTNGEHKRYS